MERWRKEVGHFRSYGIWLSKQPLPMLRVCKCLKSHLCMERGNEFLVLMERGSEFLVLMERRSESLLLLCLHAQLVLVLSDCHHPNPWIFLPSTLLPISWEWVQGRVVVGRWPGSVPAWPLLACATPLSPGGAPRPQDCPQPHRPCCLYCSAALG